MTPYYQDEWVTLYNADCTDVLSDLDRHDLLLTDPPYGIGVDSKTLNSCGSFVNGNRYGNKTYDPFQWDQCRPSEQLINALISKCDKSIVFGGNYFHLPPSRCWLVWDKQNGTNNFADCELAWTNLDKPVRLKRHLWHGLCRKYGEHRDHPTQKPFELMSWCIEQAGDTQSILDPFAGSGTTLVAAKLRNIRSTGIEREERYCEIAAMRLQQEVLNFA